MSNSACIVCQYETAVVYVVCATLKWVRVDVYRCVLCSRAHARLGEFQFAPLSPTTHPFFARNGHQRHEYQSVSHENTVRLSTARHKRLYFHCMKRNETGGSRARFRRSGRCPRHYLYFRSVKLRTLIKLVQPRNKQPCSRKIACEMSHGIASRWRSRARGEQVP